MIPCRPFAALIFLALIAASGCGSDTSAERLATLRAHLNQEGSGSEAFELFPDLLRVYSDDGHGNPGFPPEDLPYEYYWSAEGKLTVSVSALDVTVFVCPYRVDRLIRPDDFPYCDVDQSYVEAELGQSP